MTNQTGKNSCLNSMKVAVLADIHGNLHSLEAILDDLERQQPDVVVCAGDMIGPHFSGSLQVLQRLKEAGIRMVIGNQEEYILEYHDINGSAELKTSVRMRPVRFLARQFQGSTLEYLKSIPLAVTIHGPHGEDILVCHGSPTQTRRSIAAEIDEAMANELHQVSAPVIVAGHYHKHWQCRWHDKLLILAGSAGLPLRGAKGEADYLILSYQNQGWQFERQSVMYDYPAAVQALLESSFLEESGPVGWLILDEVLFQHDHLMPFLMQDISFPDPMDEAGWEKEVIGYMQRVGRWKSIKSILNQRG